MAAGRKDGSGDDRAVPPSQGRPLLFLGGPVANKVCDALTPLTPAAASPVQVMDRYTLAGT